MLEDAYTNKFGKTLLKEKIFFLSLLMSNLNYILFNSLDISLLFKNGIRIFAIILIVFSTLLNKEGVVLKKIDFMWLFLIFISLFSLNISNNFLNFLYIILVLNVCREIRKEKLIKFNYVIMVISAFFIILLLGTGLISDTEYTQDNRIRHTFGFTNVNAFSSFVYSLFLMIFMYKEKIGKFFILVLISSIYFIYRFTDTRTMVFSFFIFVVFYLFLQVIFGYKKNYNVNFLKVTLKIIVLIPIVSSLFAPLILKRYPYLDSLTSNRLTIFSNYLVDNKFINYFLGGTNVPDIDNGYLVLLLNAGIVFFVFVLLAIMKKISMLVENRDYKSLAFIVSFMYFSAFEALIIRPELSVSICFWIIIYDMEGIEEIKTS